MNKIIGIIGAMDIEIECIKGKMSGLSEKKVSGVVFYIGKIHGRDIVLAKSGIGKVNAALCAHTMAREFRVSAIINTGVAGGLANGLKVGDTVVSTAVCHHDFDTTYFPGDKHGEIYFDGESGRFGKQFFEADKPLISLAMEAGNTVCPEINLVAGIIASGDQFIYEPARKDFIIEAFGAACVEMESAAIGHACFLNNVPFVIIRALSDTADEGAAGDFMEFAAAAAKTASEITEYIVKNLQTPANTAPESS